MNNSPRVGIGVIIVKDGKILIGKRKGSHAPYYSIPGGHLELGETFEEAAIREIKEETNLELTSVEVISVVNDLVTFREENKHYISVILLARNYNGSPVNLEPDKCEGLIWADPLNLPQPHFNVSQKAVELFINNKFY